MSLPPSSHTLFLLSVYTHTHTHTHSDLKPQDQVKGALRVRLFSYKNSATPTNEWVKEVALLGNARYVYVYVFDITAQHSTHCVCLCVLFALQVASMMT